MAQPKERSVFWIVSTHVLTTGFVMPLLATLGAIAIIAPTGTRPVAAGRDHSRPSGIGYVGGRITRWITSSKPPSFAGRWLASRRRS